MQVMPLMPLRNLVVFPKAKISFEAIRPKSIRALEESIKGNNLIFLVTQKDVLTENPSMIDLYKIGVITKITQILHLQNGVVRVLAEGVKRARIVEALSETPYVTAMIREVEEMGDDSLIVNDGFIRALENTFDEYFALNKKVPPREFIKMDENTGVGDFADAICANISLPYEVKQEILEELDGYERTEKLIGAISKEIQILRISKDIEAKVKSNIDENQREYYLREELKVIEEELGEKGGVKGEADEYRKILKTLRLNKDVNEKLLKDISRFEKMQSQSPDSAVMRNYLDLVLTLPWRKMTRESLDIKNAEKILNEDHYGLEKVKERILEYLAVRTLTNGKEGSIICLVGPPGTGKTSIAKSIARALNRKFIRISLGGVHDEAEIRGHRKTYIGAMPGRLISAVSEVKVKNPLILLDEIDKMGDDFRGDPSAALLEVLDYEQNSAFRDHFTEVPFDLSEVLFITTANATSTIPAPLLDRIEIIDVSGYTTEEKKIIATDYLIPKQLAKNGLNVKNVKIDKKALQDLINYYTRESGVRNLEREIGNLMRKIAKIITSNEEKTVKVTPKTLVELLGKHKFDFDGINSKDEVGIARGLAWTSVGGDTLSIEINIMAGTGKVELTGNLGDVMKESAMTAVSFVRSMAKKLGIYEKFYKTCDIHIHVPEGAVPKDGPSAGITMATALISALTGRAVKKTVAMTGEITLRGNILPIGGLKEKSAAAYRAGIKTVLMPKGNIPDLDEITKEVKDNIEFIPVSNMTEVVDIALTKSVKKIFEIPKETEEKE